MESFELEPSRNVSPRTSIEERVHAIYQELATFPSLRPSRRVNDLFSELVGAVIQRGSHDGVRVLGDPVVRAIQESLWRICARGEFELELEWAKRVASSTHPWSTLKRFPYFSNYVRLTRMELHALRGIFNRDPRLVLFGGCGPLPLTGLLLASSYGIPVLALEVDGQACELALRVAERLGVTDLHVAQCDVATIESAEPADVVVLAALAGLRTREKRHLIGCLARVMPPGSLLLARSAHGLRTLLYPLVDPEALAPFEILLEVHPHDEIVNSILIGRAPRSEDPMPAASGSIAHHREASWRSC